MRAKISSRRSLSIPENFYHPLSISQQAQDERFGGSLLVIKKKDRFIPLWPC